MAQTFQCTLVTPERQVFDEEVVYASIPAYDGQLGVAPQRAPLMAKLGDGIFRIEFANGASRQFFVGGGFAQMKDNRLVLVSEEALAAEEVVREDAHKALAAALEIKAVTDDEVKAKARRVARARSLVALLDHQPAKV